MQTWYRLGSDLFSFFGLIMGLERSCLLEKNHSYILF